MLKVVVSGKQYAVSWSADLVEELKELGAKFDPATKTWLVEHVMKPPSERLLRAFPELASLPRGVYAGNYYYYVGAEPKFLTYTVRRYKTVSCEEYCADMCEDKCAGYDECAELCKGRCVKRCEDEEWSPRVEVEEEVKLYWAGKRPSEWAVPRGLVYLVEEKLGFKAPDYAPEVVEVTVAGDGLRDYQVQVAASLLNALKRYGGGIAQMATGAGKSYMAGALAKALQSKYAVLATTLRVDLVRQLQDYAKQFGADVLGYTVQTLYRRIVGERDVEETGDEEVDTVIKAYAKEEDVTKGEVERALQKALEGKKGLVVIVDETHHVPARTVKEVLKTLTKYVGKTLRIGLSATPWRNDGRDMEIYAWIGPVVEPRISSSYLIKHGFAVPVEIDIIHLRDECDASRGDTFAEVRKALAECDKRNQFIAKLVEKAPKPALVLTPLVKHAEALHSLIGGKTRLVTGAVDPEERVEVYNAVKKGQVETLVATTIADEGLDLPPLKTLIMALGGKSKTLTLQRVGRIVRPYPGKDIAYVYDICDDVKFFSKHCRERRKLYLTEPMWHVVDEIL